MPDTVKVRFTGPDALLIRFTSALQNDGLVALVELRESRGTESVIHSALHLVSQVFEVGFDQSKAIVAEAARKAAVDGTEVTIGYLVHRTITRFRERFPDAVEIEVLDADDEPWL